MAACQNKLRKMDDCLDAVQADHAACDSGNDLSDSASSVSYSSVAAVKVQRNHAKTKAKKKTQQDMDLDEYPNSDKQKRVFLSRPIRLALARYFDDVNNSPTIEEREELCIMLQCRYNCIIDERKITRWFENERQYAKQGEKKQRKKEQEQMMRHLMRQGVKLAQAQQCCESAAQQSKKPMTTSKESKRKRRLHRKFVSSPSISSDTDSSDSSESSSSSSSPSSSDSSDSEDDARRTPLHSAAAALPSNTKSHRRSRRK